MKTGLLKDIAKDFKALFNSEWRLKSTVFQRMQSDWIHEIGFNPSRFADEYNPVSNLFYRKTPTQNPIPLCVQILLSKKQPVQRWISFTEHKQNIQAIFDAMREQFQPDITVLLNEEAIQNLLLRRLDYWPHAYALCLWSVEKKECDEAISFFKRFNEAVENKDFPWVHERRKELEQALLRCR